MIGVFFFKRSIPLYIDSIITIVSPSTQLVNERLIKRIRTTARFELRKPSPGGHTILDNWNAITFDIHWLCMVSWIKLCQFLICT
jgi:hypothetical protein